MKLSIRFILNSFAIGFALIDIAYKFVCFGKDGSVKMAYLHGVHFQSHSVTRYATSYFIMWFFAGCLTTYHFTDYPTTNTSQVQLPHGSNLSLKNKRGGYRSASVHTIGSKSCAHTVGSKSCARHVHELVLKIFHCISKVRDGCNGPFDQASPHAHQRSSHASHDIKCSNGGNRTV
ncbi:hypothetical protein RHMOL_Rhmol10G0137100 [Rhododendron molle]|uniref:Uncharacterized protein n=1 Tax=Rhododendron molle TaxID=49168 RepID=A0ACC0M2Y9_RHOML|nr:hypothetical protein RHMOL_Rhmol10G0137100 [Rhododendron molle]